MTTHPTRRARRLTFASVAFALVAASSSTASAQVDPAKGDNGEARVMLGASVGPSGVDAKSTAEAEARAEDAARLRGLAESNTLAGGVGLIRTFHANGGEPGQFRLAFTTEYFSAGFLCTDAYPCKNPRGAGLVKGDTVNHIGGTISLGVSIAKLGPGVLDAYGSTSAIANSTNANRPSLLQTLGDTNLGLKYAGRIAKSLHVGGFFELQLVNGTGAVGLAGSGTSFRFGPLVTADLRELDSKVPLRASFNPIYSFDNRGEVVLSTEAARGTPITRVERFGLGINRVDHFDMNLGLETFLVDDRIRPFAEYSILIPTNRQQYRCRLNNPSNDDCLAIEQIAPSKLTLGSRFYPWKEGFGLTAAVDIGVTGVSKFIEEMAPTAPWTLYVGAGWAYDVTARTKVVETRVVERLVEKSTGLRIDGFVHETNKAEGIAGAVATWDDHPELNGLVTTADGHFLTSPVADGSYRFTIKADGFKDGSCSVKVGRDASSKAPAPAKLPAGSVPPPVTVDCAVEAAPKVGNVVIRVREGESGTPVANAAVLLTPVNAPPISGATDAQGVFRSEGLPAGALAVAIESPDHFSSSESIDVRVRVDNPLDVSLTKKPKSSLVSVGAKEITIKQQVQFGLGSATILPASTALLTEIADTLKKTPRIRRVEIQGHTDNSGTPDGNRSLSDARANSVRSWLVNHGVAGDRLTAKGYGQDRPLAPNVTAGNRARNRRVQFIITDQEATNRPAVPNLVPKDMGQSPKPKDVGF